MTEELYDDQDSLRDTRKDGARLVTVLLDIRHRWSFAPEIIRGIDHVVEMVVQRMKDHSPLQ